MARFRFNPGSIFGGRKHGGPIIGSRADDHVDGTDGNDRIRTGAGNDQVDAHGGRDFVRTGRGNDTVIHDVAENGLSGDTYFGGSGTDTLRLIITPEIYNSEEFQAELAKYQAQIAASGSASGAFSSLNIQFDSFEKIEVVGGNTAPIVTTSDPSAVPEGDAGAPDIVTVKVADHVTISDPDTIDTPQPYAGGLALQSTSGPLPSGGAALQSGGGLESLFSYDPVTGTISYDRAAFDYLGAGETVTATFSFNAASGPDTVPQTITVIVNGENDAPVATGESVATDDVTPIDIAVLANDTDRDASDTLFVAEASADKGVVVINNNGTLTYLPDRGFDGTATINYTVSDGNGGTDTATVTVDVTSTNQPPSVSLVPVVATLAEDADTTQPIRIADIVVVDDGVGAADLSLSGADAASFSIIGDGLYLNAGVALDFETKTSFDVAVRADDPDFTGFPDSEAAISLAISDVDEVNDPPTVVVTPVIMALPEDADTGAAIKVADVTIVDDLLGTNVLSLQGADANNFTLMPDGLYLRPGVALDFETKTSFDVTVVVDDAALGGTPDDSAAFSLAITNVNEAPVAGPALADQAAVEEAPFSFTLPADAFNDIDTANLVLTATLADGSPLPAWIAFDGMTFTGTPDDGDNTIAVRVIASDGEFTAEQNFTLNIMPVNDAPVISDQNRSIAEESLAGAVVGAVAATDVDSPNLTYAITGGNDLGLFDIDVNTGVITLTQNVDDAEVGLYDLTVDVSDGDRNSSATVTIDVTAVNDAPVAAPVDLGTSAEDDILVITSAQLLTGVSDVDGPAATITALTIQSGGGALQDNGDGSWTYTPGANDDGAATFSYTASDGEFSSSSTASLDLTPLNDAPVAAPVDLGAGLEDDISIITAAQLLAGVSDVDGPTASITELLLTSGNGDLVDNLDGTWTYTPDPNDDGAATFSYTASDGEFSSSSTASLDVTPVNDAPVIDDQSFSIAEESVAGAAVGDVVASDVDNANLIYTITAGNEAGLFAIDMNTGAITLAQTVDDSEVGSYGLTVDVSDGDKTATATITIDVTPVNDAPVISDQGLSIAEENLAGAAVGTMVATDVDSTGLTYAITAGNDAGLFAIDVDTGAMTLAQTSTMPRSAATT